MLSENRGIVRIDMKSLLRIVTAYVVIPAMLLIAGSPLIVESQSQVDYDSDDDQLIEISNLEQLDAVRHDLDGNGLPDSGDRQADYHLAFPSPASNMGCPTVGCNGYELTRNLDFTDPDSYASGLVDRGWSKDEGDEGWLPIGVDFERFGSTFEGNDHAISNLFIYRDVDYVGLFGGINSQGFIHRIGLEEVDLDGRSNTGSLAGGNDGNVLDCHATGRVSGIRQVGGLVGSNGERYGTIVDSYSAATVLGSINIGGLAGGNYNTITGSHATGDVSGENSVGGLVGGNSGPISASYATGNVWGTKSIGGLVGNNNYRGVIVSSFASGYVTGISDESRAGGLVGVNYHFIRGSYATGSVSGGRMVGGLAGSNSTSGRIVSSYAAGAVSGSYGVGGLLGFSNGKSVVIGSYASGSVSGRDAIGGFLGWDFESIQTTDSYWDIETSGQSQGVGSGPVSRAEGKTTSELQTPTAYTGIYLHWNTDIDDADGDGHETTGVDDPWDFGRNDQYPALRADFNGDGEATWEEFGLQPREGVPPSQMQPPQPPAVGANSPDSSPGSCTNGTAVENPAENPALVRDCTNLLQGKDTLAGSSTLNWSADLPIRRWHGITLGGSPTRVVGINLTSRPVSGRIPPEFGQLSALTELNFRVNDLTGGIPTELAGLTELRSLRLSGNLELGGTIPPALGNLSKLEQLDLNATGLTGKIPTEIGRLSNLQRLDLGQNRLSGSIPMEIASLSKLKGLSLHKTDLTGDIPPELAKLSNLEILHLGTNRLSGGIPPELGQLSNLFILDLAENRLTGVIPEELGNLFELSFLGLRDNQLTGEIPSWISDLSQMDWLDLSQNQLTGPIPHGLGDLSLLRLLYLHDNSLTGPIPSSLRRLSRLGDLKLDRNQLSGPIPPEFANLSSLQVMGLSHNNLTGEIPGDLGRLSELQFLLLQNNRLTGNIPPELGDLEKLRYMNVSNNELTGPIPPRFAALSELVTLQVSGNALTGCTPWLLASRAQLEITHDGLISCAPTVEEGGEFSIESSKLLENDSQTIVAVSDVVNGRALLDGTTLTYTHDGSETTSGSLSITVTDGISAFIVTITVPVIPVNDPPIVVPDMLNVDEGGTLTLQASELLGNDLDAENHALTLTSVSEAGNGSVFLDGTAIIYEHDGSETTTDGFSYEVSDGTHAAKATVTIDVNPVNDPPVAVADVAEVNEGESLSVEAAALLSNDSDAESDELNLTSIGDARNGSISLDGTTITYEHDGSETTSGSFAYTVSDGTDTSTATATITVTPVNDSPVAVGDSATVDEGDTLSIEASALLENDSDAEDDTLSITSVGDGVNGTVLLNGTTITYEHNGSETTSGSFAYTVSDGTDTSTATATITVNPVNDPPTAVGDSATVNEGDTLSIEASALLENDSDAENDTLNITSVGDGVNGTVLLDGVTITYEHDGSETTTGSFVYTVSDGTDSSTAAVTIMVNPVNDLPMGLLAALVLGAGVLTAIALLAIRARRKSSGELS